MRAITVKKPGGPEVLQWTVVPDPTPGAGEVLIEVAASAINRADLLQRQGKYAPPTGASEILGLECSGTVSELGAEVTGWQIGDEVCALLSGGGYAEKVVVPAGQLLPIPGEASLLTAAALPEVACTVWSNIIMTAGLREGQILLVHGGGSGIGTHAIQVAKAIGAIIAVTAGSDERVAKCRQLGADIAINYREQDFVAELKRETGGADVILDNMGASYLDRNIQALKTGGRLVIIGLQGGVHSELNLAALLEKRASIFATKLRARPIEEKSAIVTEVRKNLWPLVAQGSVLPIVDQVLPMSEASAAHQALEEGDVFGKILLIARS